MIELTDEILAKVIKKRKKASYKGTYGRLLVIGGNRQYGGAAILATTSAVYSGAGLVSVALAKENHSALQARLPEAMTLDFDDLIKLREVAKAADVIVIGPGLGFERLDLLTEVLNLLTENQKLVIDGSALTLFAREHLDLPFPENTVFTPHEMELERLSGLKIGQQTKEEVQDFVNQLGAIVVAKSSETRIFAPNRESFILKIGSPAQATGGMGDTLAGMVGGFLAQFHGETEEVVAAATYLHSLIASVLAQKTYVVLPSRLIEEIPLFMKKYEC